MLLENFENQSTIINEIVNLCRKNQCTKSLKEFINGEVHYITPDTTCSDIGIYTNKRTIAKCCPPLIHHYFDSLFKEYHDKPLMSTGLIVHKGKTLGIKNECIILLPDSYTAYDINPIKVFKKKNKTLKDRLSRQLIKKTHMDEFEVGKIIAKIDVDAHHSLLRNEKGFSQAYAKVVDILPHGHELVMKHYLKPLKECIEQCVKDMTKSKDDDMLVDCESAIYINIRDCQMSIEDLQEQLKGKGVY